MHANHVTIYHVLVWDEETSEEVEVYKGEDREKAYEMGDLYEAKGRSVRIASKRLTR